MLKTRTNMTTIVYLASGEIEATSRAEEFVALGIARFATAKECADYEYAFERDDAQMAHFNDDLRDEVMS